MTMLIYIVPRKLLWKFKGRVQPQMKIVSSITYTHIIPNPIRRSFIFKNPPEKTEFISIKTFLSLRWKSITPKIWCIKRFIKRIKRNPYESNLKKHFIWLTDLIYVLFTYKHWSKHIHRAHHIGKLMHNCTCLTHENKPHWFLCIK